MGNGSKIANVFLRFFELASAAIVAGLAGSYLHYVSDAGDNANSRIVYTTTVSGISILVSLVCMISMDWTFYAFWLDAALFIMWMVAFGLLIDLTGTGGCTSSRYWNSWGYYWGNWYWAPNGIVNQALVGTSACAKWRATVAWSFIGGWCWLISAILGAIVVFRIHDDKRTAREIGEKIRGDSIHETSQATTPPV